MCFLTMAARHTEEGEYLKIMDQYFMCDASCNWKNKENLEDFVMLKKISQLYCVTLEISLQPPSHL